MRFEAPIQIASGHHVKMMSVQPLTCGGTVLNYPALLTVSRNGQLLRSWDLSSGQLKYEVSTSLPPPHLVGPVPLSQGWRPGGVLAALAGKKGGGTGPVGMESVAMVTLCRCCSGSKQGKGRRVCSKKWRCEVDILC